jgi:hypothetical protein
MGKKSRTKGHSFERKIAQEFRRIYPEAQRQLEYQLNQCQGVDLKNTGPFKIQCKCKKSYSPINAIEEIKAEGIKMLVTKADRKAAVACLYLDDLLDILEDIGNAYVGKQ